MVEQESISLCFWVNLDYIYNVRFARAHKSGLSANSDLRTSWRIAADMNCHFLEVGHLTSAAHESYETLKQYDQTAYNKRSPGSSSVHAKEIEHSQACK